MGNTLIVNRTDGLATIFGLHGGDGQIEWKRLVTGGMLYGNIESLEFARVPPGVLIGLHDHTRTEELWFIVRGEATVTLNGEERRVHPQDVVLAPLGTRHSIRNTGSDYLEFFVVEVVPPSLASALPERLPSAE